MTVGGAPALYVTPYQMRVYTHERGAFSELRGTNVLLYFPHGFGDWVQFSYVLPLLERSNRYWMTRYGDDNLSLIDRSPYALPVYLGLNGTQNGDGSAFANRHFGLDYAQLDGTQREVYMPDSLVEFCGRERIEAMLWTSFPEIGGNVPYPFHTKSRNVLRHLVRPALLETFDLAGPLHSGLSFDVDPSVRQWVEARLKNLLGLRGCKLCLIARNGYTSIGKNWGHLWREDLPAGKRREGEECRDFMRLLRRSDDRWTFVILEDRLFGGDDTMRAPELRAFSYAEIFGALDQPTVPFGLVMKVLARVADLCVGVPAGPYHLCMAKAELPTVGLWIEHLPSWFDEPKEASIHVISRNVRDRAIDRKPGSFFNKPRLHYRTMPVETRVITGEQVVAAVEKVLS